MARLIHDGSLPLSHQPLFFLLRSIQPLTSSLDSRHCDPFCSFPGTIRHDFPVYQNIPKWDPLPTKHERATGPSHEGFPLIRLCPLQGSLVSSSFSSSTSALNYTRYVRHPYPLGWEFPWKDKSMQQRYRRHAAQCSLGSCGPEVHLTLLACVHTRQIESKGCERGLSPGSSIRVRPLAPLRNRPVRKRGIHLPRADRACHPPVGSIQVPCSYYAMATHYQRKHSWLTSSMF